MAKKIALYIGLIISLYFAYNYLSIILEYEGVAHIGAIILLILSLIMTFAFTINIKKEEKNE